MQLGILAKTFNQPTLEELLEAIKGHGLTCLQFNMGCVGLPTLPDQIDPALIERIRQALATRGLRMAALSGTFNMIDPDLKQRQTNLRRLRVLAAACQGLGTEVITLCTGTCDPHDMWRCHPDNGSPAAWRDLLDSMAVALEIAETYKINLGIEPEVSNVIGSARKARQLLEALPSPYLKIVIDGANLFPAGTLPRMREILIEAFDLLGEAIILAHAKDLTHDGEAGQVAAGTGLLNYDLYLELLQQAGYSGPLILHGLREDEVAGSTAFLRAKLANKGQAFSGNT
jgi:sugar phosphate isomerase/epimerase